VILGVQTYQVKSAKEGSLSTDVIVSTGPDKMGNYYDELIEKPEIWSSIAPQYRN